MTEQQSETNEVFSSIGDTVRGAVFAGIEIAILIAARRAERAQQARGESDAAARRDAQRLRAEREAAMPVMRQTWNDRWWRGATPERIGDTWQLTASWAHNGDPYAMVTLQHMREEIADRYGVTLPEPAFDGAGLAEILGADTEQAHADADRAVTGEEFAEPATTYRYSITASDFRNEAFHYDDVADGVVHVLDDDDRPAELMGAEILLAYKEQHGGDLSISMYAGDQSSGPPLAHLSVDGAVQVRDAAMQQRARILSGEQAASPEELRSALWAERRRLADEIREHDPRLAVVRDQLAAERRARGLSDPDETTRPTAATRAASPGEATERVADAREQMSQVNIRLQAVEADIRGENGSQVIQAAALRAELDDGWWQTASSEEVTALYGHVQQWDAGRAKSGMLAELEGGLSRHYGVDIDRRATPEEVEHAVFAGKAASEDRSVVGYRIDGLFHERDDDGRRHSEHREIMSGRTAVPRDEDPRETARRLLTDHSGDLNSARDQRLRVTLTDRDGKTLTSLDAADVPDTRRDADRLRGQGLDEDDKAIRSDHSAGQLDRADQPGLADAQAEDAAELHEAAEQDRDAAANLEAVPDAEAREAVTVAAEGWEQNPQQRLPNPAQRRTKGQTPARAPRTPKRQPQVER